MGDWNPKANEIFLKAAEIAADDERQAYLDQACGDDAELRAQVVKLLKAGAAAGSFLESPPAKVEATIDLAPVTERPGTMIGPFKLMEQVGEGGMGVVYVAEQREPVRRKVALKIIKPGMDSKEVIARFEAERQALALMDHPNIARVLDAGATESRRPYFVMELVRGITITEYCDQNNLSTSARLELFVTVCHAIKHAHQKGVIHRDVKPSNVMVTLHDGKPIPKIIDFGVAKAINQQLTERTVYTQYSQMVGTPLYMSPEQAEMSGLDVDTRTDIYSLGVLLYELLTGTTPFEKKRIHEAAYDEIRRIIREEEPPKPSTRISTLEKTGTSISAHRKTDPKRLSQLVRGDLDWIVMKALEKDRTRRYETANDLAADVLRHLNDEPILASSPSMSYKLRKFASRNKAAMATVSLVASALILGLIVSTWQAVRATRAERDLAKAHGKEMHLRADAETDRDRAVEAELTAERERDRAVVAERNATEERDRAEAQRDENRRLLYSSDMAGALRAWEDGVVPQVDELVERHRPKPGGKDLRGFEWYYLWRLRGQRMTVPTLQRAGMVGSMDFSPDGSSLATADVDGNVAVWDIATCQPRFQHKAYETNIGPTVVFSPDGLTVASVGPQTEKGKGWNPVVSLWDAATGRLKETLDLGGIQHLASLPDGQLAFSPDGSLLAVACFGAVRLWDVADGEFRDSLVTPGLRPAFVAFAPGGKQLASNFADGTVRLWDMETGRFQALTGPDYDANCLAFSPDGNTLACGDEDGTIRLWNVATTTQRGTLRISDRPVNCVAFSADGNRLASLSPSIKLWDLHAEKLLGSIRGGGVSIAFSPDGKTLASGAVDNTVRLWRTEPDDRGTVLTGHTGHVLSVAVSPDGGLIASSSLDSQLKLWDVVAGRERATLKSGGATYVDLAFSRDGEFLISQSAIGYAELWDVATGKRLRYLDYPKVPSISRSIALSPDGKILARGDEGGGIVLCDVADGVFREPFKKRSGSVLGLAFSPGGEMLASMIDRDTVEVWTVATGKLVHDLGDQIEPSGRPAFSPDGRVLACGCFDGRVQLWDVSTGSSLSTLEGHVGAVSSVVFSPDGATLFSAGLDNTIKLWDMETLQQRASLKGSGESIFSIAVSLDGHVLASGGTAGAVRLWRATSEEDPRKLADLLRLETSVRDIADADPNEQQRTLVELQAHLTAKAKTGLSAHDVTVVVSAGHALQSSDNLAAKERLLDFANKIGRIDDQKLRDLAAAWRVASWRQRADLHAGANEWEEALASFAEAIALAPNDRSLWADRGRAHMGSRQWDQAVADFSKAIELDAGSSAVGADRAKAYAILGRWQDAADEFERVIQGTPYEQNSYVMCGLGALQNLAGDTDGYRKTCQKALLRFSPGNVYDKARVVHLCSLAPDSGIPRMVLTPLAESGLKQEDNSKLCLAKIMDDYRNGRFEDAIAREVKGDVWTRAPISFFHAMAHKQLGDIESARRKFVEGIVSIGELGLTIDGPKPAAYLPDAWLVWCFVDVMRREAQATVGGTDFEYLYEARKLVTDGDISEAIEVFGRAIKLNSTDSLALIERGRLHARLGQWKKAAADYAKVVELHPEDVYTWQPVAPLLVLAGNEREYARHCQGMLKRFGANDNVEDTETTSQVCLLLAGAFDLTTLPLETVNRALDDGSAPNWFQGWGFGMRALAVYRAGDAAKAVHWVRKSQGTQTYADKPRLQAQVLAILAMAQHQLEQPEEAQKALIQARELIDAHLPKLAMGELGHTWADWLIAEILRREAQALIDGAAAETTSDA